MDNKNSKKGQIIALVVCIAVIIAVAIYFVLVRDNKNNSGKDKEDTKTEESKNESVDDIFAGYSFKDGTIKTVYGTATVKDFKEALNAKTSEVAVTPSALESEISSFLSVVDKKEVDDEFIEKYCKWMGIESKDAFNEYCEKLIYQLNVYNAVYSKLADSFELVEYSDDIYDKIIAEIDENYNSQIKSAYSSYGIEDLEGYCEAMGMSVDEFRNAYYDVEGQILNRIICIYMSKEYGLEVNEESQNRSLKEIAFQSGLTEAEEAKNVIGNKKSELQLTTASLLFMEWLVDNVKVVNDMDTEPAVINQVEGPKKGDTVAAIKVKDYGTIKIRLFGELAPKAVENFTTHSKDGYYDNLTFHRIIDNFMIQGGDPLGDGTGGESIYGEAFEDEFSVQLIPVRGALCMANSGADTNGSQFFIVQSTDYRESFAKDLLSLGVADELVNYYKENGGYASYGSYTVFGQVYEGMDVVDKIASVEVDTTTNKPKTDVVIESIKISTYNK